MYKNETHFVLISLSWNFADLFISSKMSVVFETLILSQFALYLWISCSQGFSCLRLFCLLNELIPFSLCILFLFVVIFSEIYSFFILICLPQLSLD